MLGACELRFRLKRSGLNTVAIGHTVERIVAFTLMAVVIKVKGYFSGILLWEKST